LALGRDQSESGKPDNNALIDVQFPFRSGSSRKGSVLYWYAPSGTDAVNDCCVLALRSSLGEEVEPARFAEAGRDVEFRAACRTGQQSPLHWVYGAIGELTTGGLYQVYKKRDDKRGFITPGCSGGPAISGATRHVLGMVVWANQEDERGHIAPTQTLIQAFDLRRAAAAPPSLITDPVLPPHSRLLGRLASGLLIVIVMVVLLGTFRDLPANLMAICYCSFALLAIVAFPAVARSLQDVRRQPSPGLSPVPRAELIVLSEFLSGVLRFHQEIEACLPQLEKSIQTLRASLEDLMEPSNPKNIAALNQDIHDLSTQLAGLLSAADRPVASQVPAGFLSRPLVMPLTATKGYIDRLKDILLQVPSS
jgi:hypothetical protein